jgi:hypothetical protein
VGGIVEEGGRRQRCFREREGKERWAGSRHLSTRDEGHRWGKRGLVWRGCEKGRGPCSVGTRHSVELRRRRGGQGMGPAVGTNPTPTETGSASHTRAREGEGKAGQWARCGVGSSWWWEGRV